MDTRDSKALKEKWIKRVNECKDSDWNADNFIIGFSKELWPNGDYNAALVLIAGLTCRTKDKVKEWINGFA